MIIVSLTTIPTRFPCLHTTIDSILSQTIQPDVVVIHIPTNYNNYSYDHKTIPTFSSDKVIINNNVKDYGPATKLLGLRDFDIYKEMNDDDIIIVVDDDRIYNENLIKNMLNYHKIYPDKTLTVSGWDVETLSQYKTENKKQPRGVEFKKCGYSDFLGGCCGFLLNKKMCPFRYDEIFDLNPTEDYYYVDDIWISGFLTLHNTEIYIVPNSIFGDEKRSDNDSISPLYDKTRSTKNMKCIEYFRNKYNIFK
jgi:hypothetical protein